MREPSFQTQRLKFKVITNNDFDALYQTMDDQETCDIVSFLHWPLTNNQVQSWLNKAITGHTTKTDYMCIAYENSTPAGYIGLHIKPENRQQAEIGYWVASSYKGQGIATEMVTGITDFTFSQTDVTELFATTALENTASEKVLTKNGFTENGNIDVPMPNGTPRPSKYFIKQK